MSSAVFKTIILGAVALLAIALLLLPTNPLLPSYLAGTVALFFWTLVVVPLTARLQVDKGGLQALFWGLKLSTIAVLAALFGIALSALAYAQSSATLASIGTSLFLCAPLILISGYRPMQKKDNAAFM